MTQQDKKQMWKEMLKEARDYGKENSDRNRE